MKPHIKRSRRSWKCYGAMVVGFGATPSAAYRQWLGFYRRVHGANPNLAEGRGKPGEIIWLNKF